MRWQVSSDLSLVNVEWGGGENPEDDANHESKHGHVCGATTFDPTKPTTKSNIYIFFNSFGRMATLPWVSM